MNEEHERIINEAVALVQETIERHILKTPAEIEEATIRWACAIAAKRYPQATDIGAVIDGSTVTVNVRLPVSDWIEITIPNPETGLIG